MDSHDRFIKKIETIKGNPQLSSLKILVSDLWSWSESYGKGYNKIKDMADDIEVTIAICFDEGRELNQAEQIHVNALLNDILKELNNFIN